MMMLAGPFTSLSAGYEFTAERGSGVDLSLVVDGGEMQECVTIGVSEVTVNTIALPIGGTVTDSIYWTVDAEDAGVGDAISPFLSLGIHAVEAVATTTTGETDSASVNVVIEDTTAPELDIAFLDRSGQEIDVARPGPVEIRVTATDLCDASPLVSNRNAVPTYGVSSGDVIHITPSNARTPAEIGGAPVAQLHGCNVTHGRGIVAACFNSRLRPE
jgi:hypothetical protein